MALPENANRMPQELEGERKLPSRSAVVGRAAGTDRLELAAAGPGAGMQTPLTAD